MSFLDADSGEVLGKSSLAPEELPECFDSSSTVELTGKTWDVVRAQPPTRKAFRKSRSLTLWIRPFQDNVTIDPAKILYSLPTIADELPAVTDVPTTEQDDILRIMEDDWRQIEFISLTKEDAIDTSLAGIRRVHEEERQGVGFKKLYLRDDPRNPLQGITIKTSDVLAGLGPDARRFDGVGFHRVSGRIEGAFAFETGSLLRGYGLEQNGLLELLCLLTLKESAPFPVNFLELARRHELCLVDWCRAIKVLPDENHYKAYFEQ